MRALRKTRAWVPMLLACGLVAATGCGEKQFANKPRPAASVDLTGVIESKGVTVDPARVGAGPVLITISNQDTRAHSVTLSGGSIEETVGPIQPLDTGTIQKSLPPGSYQVSAGSDTAVAREIMPAQLTVGKKRASSSGELLLP